MLVRLQVQGLHQRQKQGVLLGLHGEHSSQAKGAMIASLERQIVLRLETAEEARGFAGDAGVMTEEAIAWAERCERYAASFQSVIDIIINHKLVIAEDRRTFRDITEPTDWIPPHQWGFGLHVSPHRGCILR